MRRFNDEASKSNYERGTKGQERTAERPQKSENEKTEKAKCMKYKVEEGERLSFRRRRGELQKSVDNEWEDLDGRKQTD
jgi:hypothetical protein